MAFADIEPVSETDGDMLARLGTDAEKWAKEFVVKVTPGIPTLDKELAEEILRTWFACAIEAGRSAGRAQPRDLVITKSHAIGAVGYLSAVLAGPDKADAWRGNAPHWFPQPPEWLTLWEEAVNATRDLT